MPSFGRLFPANVGAPMVLIQLAVPLLAARRGLIVNITSDAASGAYPGWGPYGATKAALTSLCETLNTEESEGGILATAVCPGYVATDMTAGLADQLSPDLMIDPGDVAEVVVALTRLSGSAVIPQIAMTRPGPHLWRC